MKPTEFPDRNDALPSFKMYPNVELRMKHGQRESSLKATVLEPALLV
jgi:hypothetical protein